MTCARTFPPCSTIGVMGGGQLGRMFAIAARRMGYRVHTFSPDEDTPTGQLADREVAARYDDEAAVRDFARGVDVLTFEFENIPAQCIEWAAEHCVVRPAGRVLHICQHRLREKEFFRKIGLGTASYQAIASDADIARATALPGILKTCTEGYDGKGQMRVESRNELAAAWHKLGQRECILEALVDFQCEVSAIVARGLDGQTRCFPIGLNEHRGGILRTTTVPSGLPAGTVAEAERLGVQLARSLELTGLVALEMFVTRDGRVLANEMAPRPHNSGHWTIDACATSQFEQLVRAICGLPLGAVDILAPSRMENLIGDEARDWLRYLADPTARLHLYGKARARPGRKMGHVTFLETSGVPRTAASRSTR